MTDNAAQPQQVPFGDASSGIIGQGHLGYLLAVISLPLIATAAVLHYRYDPVTYQPVDASRIHLSSDTQDFGDNLPVLTKKEAGALAGTAFYISEGGAALSLVDKDDAPLRTVSLPARQCVTLVNGLTKDKVKVSVSGVGEGFLATQKLTLLGHQLGHTCEYNAMGQSVHPDSPSRPASKHSAKRLKHPKA